MSYNVSHSEIVSGVFTIPSCRVRELRDNLKCCAESNIYDQIEENYRVDVRTDGNTVFDKSTFWWNGSGSGDLDPLKEFLSLGKGPVDIVLIYEGGDSFLGLRVDEFGNVTEHDVKMVLCDS